MKKRNWLIEDLLIALFKTIKLIQLNACEIHADVSSDGLEISIVVRPSINEDFKKILKENLGPYFKNPEFFDELFCAELTRTLSSNEVKIVREVINLLIY